MFRSNNILLFMTNYLLSDAGFVCFLHLVINSPFFPLMFLLCCFFYFPYNIFIYLFLILCFISEYTFEVILNLLSVVSICFFSAVVARCRCLTSGQLLPVTRPSASGVKGHVSRFERANNNNRLC